MSVLRKAKNTVVQGGIAATQVNGNVYNSPAEITNVSVANIQNNHLRGELVGSALFLFSNPRGWISQD